MPASMLTATDTKLCILILNHFKDSVDGLNLVNQDVIFAPEENALRVRAERKNGTDAVEFISYWRTDTQFDWKRQKTSAGVRGLYGVQSGTTLEGQKAVPVLLTYDMTYHTRVMRNVNSFTERYLFWLHNMPRLFFTFQSSEIPQGLDIVSLTHPEITVNDWFNDSRYYKVKCRFSVEGWIFENVNISEVTQINLDIYMENNTGKNPVLVAHDVIVPTP
jgi:hypothetical protein